MTARILLTGAATLVGAEVLKELLARPQVEAIRLLLPAGEARQRRTRERLEAYLGPLPSSIEMIAGDLRLPRFGFSLATWDELAAWVNTGFHCAQREIRDRNLELARQANVWPVETWLQLLGHNPVLRLHHLSTAFVGGTRRGLLTEFDLDCGQGFHDAWERSKFEAEVRLRESPASDRVTIYRPSHTLGRAATGEAFHLEGAYALLASLAAAPVLPGDAHARIDLVPADWVAAAMVALAGSGAGTFHLACGWAASLPVREAADLAARGRGGTRGARLLPRAVAGPLRLVGAAAPGGLASRGLAFTTARNLLHQGPVFDTYLAGLALAPLGLPCPAPAAWLETAARSAHLYGWQAPPVDEMENEPAAVAVPPSTAAPAVPQRDPVFREKRFHQVGDAKVAYRDLGRGEPVVFLHGLAGAHSWDAVVERVMVRRRAIVIETLGLGDSAAPLSADFGLPAQAAMVRGLLSALEIPAAHLVGNEIGGVIAQLFAVRWPHCVKSLALSDCDTHGRWPPPQVERLAAVMSLPALLRVPAVARSRMGFGRMFYDKGLLTRERLEQLLAPITASRERRTRLKRFLRAFDPADLAGLNHRLGQLEVPTVIVWGADNEYFSPSWGKRLCDAIPGARRLELIPFAGISCHEERPDVFASLLEKLWDEQQPTTEDG
jgi:pimeloyl-ACP methyl ester carboxylesterase/nucleoside-diphosphate-sugar epimerase